MSPRVFLGWLVLTAVTVVLTIVVGLGRETSSFDLIEREPVFAQLRDAPESATKIEIESRFGAFTMNQGGDGWVTPERDDYPIDEGDIRRLIVGLSDMRYVERKTSNPERFYRLEVQDIETELSDSVYVKVQNAQGGVLAETIVGRPSARFFEGRASGTYIREAGTNNVWLVTGVTNVQTRLIPWLKRNIVGIPANRVASISVGTGEGAYTISRNAPEDEGFSITGAPEGRKLDGDKATSVSRALASVELEDVRPRTELALPDDASVASVTTFDGLTVNVRLAELDRKKWAIFDAAYTGDPADQSEGAVAARASVEEINARVGKWVYWLPSATFTNLTRPIDDVLVAKDDDSS
ncbi:MAG: DUF4340 domain-containing protein [Rhodospirillaceae bacterium]|jgi:hypothetical protein|nr:DUF4340 domain-containing protein [Rhodospirillaceae bacterium]MBT6536132.1 DUF4340 domain-containing protein [Rhodospirillaceae bacterium]MBT7360348.1 DUF4340 domain-containing protein [Rhodospirillaceae bacterium]